MSSCKHCWAYFPGRNTKAQRRRHPPRPTNKWGMRIVPHPLRNARQVRPKSRQHAAKLNAPERLCDTQWKSNRAKFILRCGNLATQQESRPDRESPSKPGWRNWQTQRTQNPSKATSWGFKSPSRHHNKLLIFNNLKTMSGRPMASE